MVYTLYHDGFQLTKQVESQPNHPLRGTTLEERFKACLDAYEQLTGYHETNANAVLHHRLALYGPPCSTCGKPLRTPQASLCVACGAPKQC